jgi:hypothetical protein
MFLVGADKTAQSTCDDFQARVQVTVQKSVNIRVRKHRHDYYQRFHEPPQLVCEYCGGSGRCEDGSSLLPAAPREHYLDR